MEIIDADVAIVGPAGTACRTSARRTHAVANSAAVIALFLWHAAHRLRVTLHDFGLRQDAAVAVIVYVIAAAGTLATFLYLLRI